mgnify:CR=1 FL=1
MMIRKKNKVIVDLQKTIDYMFFFLETKASILFLLIDIMTKQMQKKRIGAENIRKPSIRRLMTRSGCRRVSRKTYALAMEMFDIWMEDLLVMCEQLRKLDGRKTIFPKDVIFALAERHGIEMFGM